jgi:hypothetical protein
VQSKPLITLDDVLLRYCSGDRIVTANERLARALIAANDRHPRSKGGIAPASSCISTLADYLRGRYLEIEPTSRSRTLLNTDAQRLVWLEHTPDVPDIDFVGLYPRIADAWRVMHDWALLPALEQFDDNENHRLFRDWSQLYLRTARSRGWMTEAEIPAAIEFAVRERRLHGETLLLIGFDVIPPSLDRMFDAYRSAGATVLRYETARAIETRVAAVSCNDPDEELRAAVYWARTVQREASEPQSLCIAVPDLVESHDRVVRQLDAILRADDDSPAAATSPYNVSGGVPLSSVPVVADALDLLGWLFEPFHHTRIDSLLHSPFLCWSEMSIDRDEWQPEWCDAARYGAVASVSPLREIVYRASRMGLLDLKEQSPARDTAGSGGLAERRPPVQRELSGLPVVRGHARRTRGQFELRAAASLLHDAAAAAPGGRLPAVRAGAPASFDSGSRLSGNHRLEFTGLWVTGLNQLDWPGSPTPTPFIPVRHLKAASVARSDVDGEVAFARRLMRHWRASAGMVVFSHAVVRDDVPCRRSALVDEVAPTVDLHLDAPGLALSHPHFAALPVSALNTFDDVEVGSADLQRLQNRGSGILRDQSACPFRAFARYRLHARQVTPRIHFPTRRTAVWQPTPLCAACSIVCWTRKSPISTYGRFAIAASESAAAAIASLGPLPALFRDSEQNRMTALLLEWLELERLRPPHRIVANEVATELVLHGIEFDLRIDRVDVVPDGSLLVVDYKTAQTNPNVCHRARPEEPQLPMYALSTPGVAAIAFAQVERDECRMIGWSGITYSIAQSAERVRFNQVGTSDAGWNVQLDEWRASLTGLATEFRSGVSAVRPRDAFACNECNLHALCRIREIRRIEPG